MNNFSDKETKLIKYFGFGEYLDNEHFNSNPLGLYRIIIEYCFINNIIGYEVDSLRRCYKAILNSTPYRMTKEFDDLIY